MNYKTKKGLPSKDSYVDLTQIFKISKDDFEKVFNKNDVIYLDSNDLNHEDITKIYNGLYENLSQEPPSVSVSLVFEDEDKVFKSYMIYSEKKLLDYDFQKMTLSPMESKKYKEFIDDVIQNRNTDEDFKDEVQNIKNAVREEFKYYVYYLREELKENSIIFNELEEKAEHEALILCDSDNEKYYLSMRDKLDYWGETWELNDNHILVTINKDNNKVQKFINTSSIFKISENNFNAFNRNEIIYLSSDIFVQEDIEKIVNKVNENIENNLNISFIEVTKPEDKNELEAKNLYSSKEKLKLAFEEKIWYDEQMYKDFSREVLVNRNHQNLDKIKEFKEIFKNWYKGYLKENKQSNSNAYTI
ncbi:Mbov_0400 family ICE element protein [Mycoplasmopsis cynos]|uniref:Mbov_0400 family ICE element protein n=2 Tax=Mycoplasmopsis cynos TaxID=171284 RepID=UPI00396A6FBC